MRYTKLIGYVTALIGLAGVGVAAIKEIRDPVLKLVNIPLAQINENYLLIGGIILVVIGIYIIQKHSKHHIAKGVDVPIYRGNKIVGYRTN